jgi:hypothetical protein
MSDVEKPQPVDNSHRDAGIAAREAKQETKIDQVAQKAAEKVEEHQEAETQNDAGDTAAQDQDATGAQGRNKKPGVHQRIDELTKEKHDARRAAEDAQRERDHWRQQAEQALRLQQPKESAPPAQAAKPGDEEPTLESCDFDQAKFQREWYQYQRTQEKRQEAEQERSRKLAEKEQAFRAKFPDYDTVARNPALPITQQVAEVILDTDDPPAIAYYLGQNPTEAAAIAQMTPHQIGRAIGRIEAKLSAPPATEAPRQPEPKTVTNAPAPVTTLSGSPAVKKSLDDLSMREYAAERRKERLAKGLAP